jgi:L-threonylcarbamoyladenylate synthase
VHGRPDPRRLDDIPEEIRAAVAATLDGGELPGTPSTVLDLTGSEPVVLREGVVPAAEALARVAVVLGE